jgi:hypothetical protein
LIDCVNDFFVVRHGLVPGSAIDFGRLEEGC